MDYPENEKELLELGIIESMSTLLASTEFELVKSQTLGVMLDLVESIQGRSYLLKWRHQNGQYIANVLIDMWVSESQKTNFTDTLITTVGESDVSLNSKIFAMFSKLGFDSLQSTLSSSEQTTMLEVQKYLDYKIGQVWSEIGADLLAQGIRPTTPDMHCIETANQVTLAKFQSVSTKQAALRERETVYDVNLERFTYGVLASSKKRGADKVVPSGNGHKIRVHTPFVAV